VGSHEKLPSFVSATVPCARTVNNAVLLHFVKATSQIYTRFASLFKSNNWRCIQLPIHFVT